MDYPYPLTVTVERPGGSDPFGDPLPGTSHPIPGCAVSPRSSTEETGGRSTVIVGYTLLAPFGADIAARDTVILPDGSRWQVVGEPGRWRSPFTDWMPGAVMALEKVTG